VASFSVQFRCAIPRFKLILRSLFLLCALLRFSGVVHAQSGGLALTHVTIIDPTVGKTQDMTFLVRGHDIAAVGRAKRITIPAPDKVIDGTGKFVIPGVWDMHSHFRDARRDLKIDREEFQTVIKYSHLEIVDKCFACT
jgi:imidazolonepropionase-like amidohydrolase